MNYRIEYFDNYAQQWEPVGDNHLNQWPTLEAAEDSTASSNRSPHHERTDHPERYQ
jgi:hypothetical protein